MTIPSKYVPRKLAERSNLLFEFPQTNERRLQVYLPMLENCQISEAKKANLASYDLLGRSNTIYAYMGAKSRTINLKFNITLLNVLDYIEREGLAEKFKQQFNIFNESRETRQKYFLIESLGGPYAGLSTSMNSDIKYGNGMPHSKIHREYFQKLINARFGNGSAFDDFASFLIKGLGETPTFGSGANQFKNLNRTIDLIMFWVNLVRCSVNNNSQNTSLGPPIVRLTHGIMYNNIPCVVESQNIRIMDESGYDTQTMLPRQIEISMTLNEVRIGNYGKFVAKKFVDGDNNVGWEAVITENNMDPYNGLIGVDDF